MYQRLNQLLAWLMSTNGRFDPDEEEEEEEEESSGRISMAVTTGTRLDATAYLIA